MLKGQCFPYPAVLYQTSGESRSNTTWLKYHSNARHPAVLHFFQLCHPGKLPQASSKSNTDISNHNTCCVCDIIMECGTIRSIRCTIDQFIIKFKTMRSQYYLSTHKLYIMYFGQIIQSGKNHIWPVVIL